MSVMATNDSSFECICSDLQKDEYSPFYAWFNYIVIICLLPWLSIFGLLTNICNVYIFSRKRMRNSANTYLFFLACSDFLVILTGLFIFWIDSARTYIQELSQAPYTTVYALPFGYMAQTSSVYFTVAAAVDCYVSVCWKSRTPNYCTVRRARQICGGVAALSILYNSMRFPQFNLRKCVPDGSDEFVIEICPTTLFYTINTIYNVYMYMVLMTLMPFFFLLVLNTFIVVKQSIETQKIKKISRVSINNGRASSPILFKNGNEPMSPIPVDEVEADDTITMIMVVVLFLCCNTLALIVNIIETFFEPDQTILHTLSDASNFLVVLNSSVNCVIYYVFNKEYRELFQYHILSKIVCCSKEERQRPSLYFENTKKKSEANGLYPNYMKMANPSPICNPASPVWRPLNWPSEFSSNTADWPSESTLPNTEFTRIPQSPCPSFVPSVNNDIQLMDEDESDSGLGVEGSHTIIQNEGPKSLEVRLVGEKEKVFIKSADGTEQNVSVTAL
ncbi:unnamed protein product [Bursaphelenchus okinawaensis]|uniref:G-protein coupled receptors family 1 profile domain-containing protein n=1 Tax=Bursaphelenchus okinawaensis TaxID=465554 RepID=A0A811L7E1_9BILA|nr:unnamed protein product [Bursaphelenchus okinawaensis]CAG9118311.1 unnamed protein product [Bursaphelenchus okinawaensis]